MISDAQVLNSGKGARKKLWQENPPQLDCSYSTGVWKQFFYFWRNPEIVIQEFLPTTPYFDLN
jgi:hypothetical protein